MFKKNEDTIESLFCNQLIFKDLWFLIKWASITIIVISYSLDSNSLKQRQKSSQFRYIIRSIIDCHCAFHILSNWLIRLMNFMCISLWFQMINVLKSFINKDEWHDKVNVFKTILTSFWREKEAKCTHLLFELCWYSETSKAAHLLL